MPVCVAHARVPRAIVAKVSAKDRAQIERIQSLAAKNEVKIAAGFLSAVERIRAEIDLDAIEELLKRSRYGEAEELIQAAITRAGYGPLTSAVRATIIAGGTMAAKQATGFRPGQLDVVFDVVNQSTAQFLRQYQMDQIRELTREARAVVRQALSDGINAGRNPLTTARDIRAVIGLTRRQDMAVRNFRRMLEEGDRTALQRDLRDRRFDAALRRMDEKPLSKQQIDKMVTRYRERYLKYRSETIARTESIRAVQAGQHELWKQATEDGTFIAAQVTRAWVYTNDSKVRDWHRSIPSLNPDGRGLSEPFDTELGPLMYPGDPNGTAENVINCRCVVLIRYVPTLVD